MEHPPRNDWVTGVVQDLEKVQINLELIQIENMSESVFKNICKQKLKKHAFEYLISKKNSRQKKTQANYANLEMAKYLQEDEFSIKEKQHLFQCRMDDLDVKANRNWKFENLICRSCDDPTKVETQQHILVCTALVNRNMKISYLPSYQDLYSDHVEDQMYTSMILGENIRLSLVPM